MPRIEITLCNLSARFTEGLVPIMDLLLRNKPDLASQIDGASRSSPSTSTNSVAADC